MSITNKTAYCRWKIVSTILGLYVIDPNKLYPLSTHSFSSFQFGCCGVNNYTDWDAESDKFPYGPDDFPYYVPKVCCENLDISEQMEMICQRSPDSERIWILVTNTNYYTFNES